ncbi:MAG: magnesium protoporphyrin IX methyltransferase [Pseudomonadota bacterium]
MIDDSYSARRDQLEIYFDQTASEAWSQLTSDAKVSGIRATVRAGRSRMRAQLLSWLPETISGRRILDAGCGTGALAIAAAERGADVVAIDIANSLIDVARQRTPDHASNRITYEVGDMLSDRFGSFDHVVAMDSLIHYDADDITNALAQLAARTTGSIVFTFAPATPALRAMHVTGRLFPRSDRAPAIVPVSERRMRQVITSEPRLSDWRISRHGRIGSGFYTSHGMELVRR